MLPNSRMGERCGFRGGKDGFDSASVGQKGVYVWKAFDDLRPTFFLGRQT